jgi:hypothetical protein
VRSVRLVLLWATTSVVTAAGTMLTGEPPLP